MDGFSRELWLPCRRGLMQRDPGCQPYRFIIDAAREEWLLEGHDLPQQSTYLIRPWLLPHCDAPIFVGITQTDQSAKLPKLELAFDVLSPAFGGPGLRARNIEDAEVRKDPSFSLHAHDVLKKLAFHWVSLTN